MEKTAGRENILQATDLESGYGLIRILQGVNFIVKRGEIVSIIGRNGVGKTTLMRTIVGLNKTMSGYISLNNKDITKTMVHNRAKRGIGYVPQGHVVFPELTVEENLKMGEGLNAKGSRTKGNYDLVYDYFPRLAERKNQKAGTMSGGEQAMLAIGRVLTGSPGLILLDEPSEGVQPNIVQLIGDIMLRINKELRISILLVEQHIGLIQHMSQRCYAMDKGLIIDEIQQEEISNYERLKQYLSV